MLPASMRLPALALAVPALLGLWWLLRLWRLGTRAAWPLASDAAGSWLVSHPDAVVVDMRTPWEYRAGHIPGARSRPLRSGDDGLMDLPRDRPVLLVCQHGPRSRVAAGLLARRGFRRLYELQGGMSRWQGPVAREEQP